jgi:hypothetical protein
MERSPSALHQHREAQSFSEGVHERLDEQA